MTDIAAEKLEESPHEIATKQIERRRISLYHSHIPKMEEVGLVEFDPDRRTVTLEDDRPAPARVRQWIVGGD